jgi:hypothetical protein
MEEPTGTCVLPDPGGALCTVCNEPVLPYAEVVPHDSGWAHLRHYVDLEENETRCEWCGLSLHDGEPVEGCGIGVRHAYHHN